MKHTKIEQDTLKHAYYKPDIQSITIDAEISLSMESVLENPDGLDNEGAYRMTPDNSPFQNNIV